MNKRASAITLIILLLIAAVVSVTGLLNGDSGKGPSSDKRADGAEISDHRPGQTGNPTTDLRGPSPRHLGNPSTGLTKNAKPATPEPYTSTVKGDLQPGETLVMGGQLLPNGLHEFTFMTPTAITLEDGTQAIKLETRTIGIKPEFARERGLNSLTTLDRHTQQRAEAWSAEDTNSTLQSLSDDSIMLSSPDIIVRPGQAAKSGIGDQNGGPGYSTETTATINADGSFSIESKVVRVPARQG